MVVLNYLVLTKCTFPEATNTALRILCNSLFEQRVSRNWCVCVCDLFSFYSFLIHITIHVSESNKWEQCQLFKNFTIWNSHKVFICVQCGHVYRKRSPAINNSARFRFHTIHNVLRYWITRFCHTEIYLLFCTQQSKNSALTEICLHHDFI